MRGRKRSCLCAEVSEEQIGKRLTLTGWVQRQRDLGGLTFITLRDRSGLIQLVVDEESSETAQTVASEVRSEYVLIAEGVFVIARIPILICQRGPGNSMSMI